MNEKNRIKIGDYVRIDNPEMFVRCGYPLGIEDMRKEIKDNHLSDIEKFIISIVCDKDDRAKEFYSDGIKCLIQTDKADCSDSANAIIDILAYRMLRHRNFGGRERAIHTKTIEAHKWKICQVTGTKMCVTGNYVAGSKCYDNWNGGYEYEPPYLLNQKSHRLLALSIPACIGETKFIQGHECMIEECHVTKIDRS
jgi:hypothetical protein